MYRSIVSDLRIVHYDLDIESYEEKIFINKIINYVKEFELSAWKAKDLFAPYRSEAKDKGIKPVEFSEVKKQLEKIVIFKLLHLKSIIEEPTVIYEKYVPKLNKKIGISSEYMTIRTNRFEQFISHFKSYDRTKGTAIEVNALLPYFPQLEDSDKHSSYINAILPGPSNVFVLNGYAYNGFELGNLDLGFKVEKDTDMARLVIDFSSIPNFDKIVSQTPKLLYRSHKPNIGREHLGKKGNFIETEVEFELLAPGIFYGEKDNMKEEEVLTFEFTAYEPEA